MIFIGRPLLALLLNYLVVILASDFHIFFAWIWAAMVVSPDFGSPYALIKVTFDTIEIDGSAGWHVVTWVV